METDQEPELGDSKKHTQMEAGVYDFAGSLTFGPPNCQPLEELEDLIIGGFGLQGQQQTYTKDKLVLSHCVSRTGTPFLCIWQPISSNLSKNTIGERRSVFLQYLPTLYVIATFHNARVDGRPLICLRMTTFHGKIVSELRETEDRPLTDEGKLNFVERLTSNDLRLCRGLCIPSKDGDLDLMDRTLRLDPQTFTFLYLVEQFDEEIIVRSRQCKFVLYKDDDGDVCKELSLIHI